MQHYVACRRAIYRWRSEAQARALLQVLVAQLQRQRRRKGWDAWRCAQLRIELSAARRARAERDLIVQQFLLGERLRASPRSSLGIGLLLASAERERSAMLSFRSGTLRRCLLAWADLASRAALRGAALLTAAEGWWIGDSKLRTIERLRRWRLMRHARRQATSVQRELERSATLASALARWVRRLRTEWSRPSEALALWAARRLLFSCLQGWLNFCSPAERYKRMLHRRRLVGERSGLAEPVEEWRIESARHSEIVRDAKLKGLRLAATHQRPARAKRRQQPDSTRMQGPAVRHHSCFRYSSSQVSTPTTAVRRRPLFTDSWK